MKVLFVDDDSSLLEQAKIHLESKDDSVKIETASSAERGLDKFENGEWDCIVSDFKMPGMNGLGFLEKIRKKKSSNIPFILFTGKGGEEVAMEATNMGADGYIKKDAETSRQYELLLNTIQKTVDQEEANEDENSLKNLQNNLRNLTSKLEDIRENARKRKTRLKKIAERAKKAKREFKKGKRKDQRSRITGPEGLDPENINPEILPSRILALKRFEEKAK